MPASPGRQAPLPRLGLGSGRYLWSRDRFLLVIVIQVPPPNATCSPSPPSCANSLLSAASPVDLNLDVASHRIALSAVTERHSQTELIIRRGRTADCRPQMRHQIATLYGSAVLLLAAGGSADVFTPKHEPGRCAFRGHCGKQSFFGKELPCVDNGIAEDPDAELRKELVDLCGSQWSEGPICCTLDQVKLIPDEPYGRCCSQFS